MSYQVLDDDGGIFSFNQPHSGKRRRICTKPEPLRSISAIPPLNLQKTPITTIAFADFLYDTGLPHEMFQIITDWPKGIGEEVITNENIDLIPILRVPDDGRRGRENIERYRFGVLSGACTSDPRWGIS